MLDVLVVLDVGSIPQCAHDILRRLRSPRSLARAIYHHTQNQCRCIGRAASAHPTPSPSTNPSPITCTLENGENTKCFGTFFLNAFVCLAFGWRLALVPSPNMRMVYCAGCDQMDLGHWHPITSTSTSASASASPNPAPAPTSAQLRARSKIMKTRSVLALFFLSAFVCSAPDPAPAPIQHQPQPQPKPDPTTDSSKDS